MSNLDFTNIQPASELPPHVQRMVDEFNELDERVVKLYQFIHHNPLFEDLDLSEAHDMEDQLEYMTKYRTVLNRRLDRAYKAAGIK